MIYFKEGVLIDNIRPEMVIGMVVAHASYQEHGLDLWITSANDRTHSETSLHYAGQALDYRTRHVPGEASKIAIAGHINEALPDDFDCVVESDHLHHEWQPKRSNR